ncbi:unnamed protein product [Pleuronectes platessa]|uniref:Uncharacterized protein n=1 Tax=Pleuronectes platessa TaxID=8262 RepID=A0A9N7UCP0_PLEPL|nr:unnamed protein product [Pleuronectes platessa]
MLGGSANLSSSKRRHQPAAPHPPHHLNHPHNKPPPNAPHHPHPPPHPPPHPNTATTPPPSPNHWPGDFPGRGKDRHPTEVKEEATPDKTEPLSSSQPSLSTYSRCPRTSITGASPSSRDVPREEISPQSILPLSEYTSGRPLGLQAVLKISYLQVPSGLVLSEQFLPSTVGTMALGIVPNSCLQIV